MKTPATKCEYILSENDKLKYCGEPATYRFIGGQLLHTDSFYCEDHARQLEVSAIARIRGDFKARMRPIP